MKLLRLALLAVMPATLMLPALPAHSEDAKPTRELSLKELITGNAVPLSVRAKDLNESFARFQFDGSSSGDAQRMLVRSMFGMNVAANSIYFTKGDTVKLESGTYLIVYGLENRVDMEAVARHDMRALKTVRKLRPKDKLLLSLLDLKNVGNITDLRSFNFDDEMENAADRNIAVVNTLQQLGAGILQWKHNRGQERLPKWQHLVTPALRQQMYPFVHDRRLWDHPSTGETFRLNPAMSGVRMPDVTNRSQVYLVYEVTPAPDGTRGVLFADGRAERVSNERWDTVRKVKPAGTSAAEIAARQQAMQAQMRQRRLNELKRLEAAEKAAQTRKNSSKTRR